MILDIWNHIEPRYGGVGPAASSLASAVSRCRGIRGRQIAICHRAERKLADGIDDQVETLQSPALRGWSDLRIQNALRQAVFAADVCHVHGLWVPHSLAVRRLAAQMGKPLVSSVHGMLEIWEMHNKRLKKTIYSYLFERPSLSRSLCLRALSDREVGDYRRFGTKSPIAIVPNGINPLEPIKTEFFLEQFPQLKAKSIILFLGRIFHKKGVLNLLKAWKSVTVKHENAHLLIAGPEYEDTGVKARKLISELDLANSVTILGVISGQTKLAALSCSKFFCLPSYSEGLSVAVLEALSIGLPVIITPECNVPSVASSGAGIDTSNDPTALADTLVASLSLTSREWTDMSVAAKQLARTQFDWNTTGKQMNSVYEWLLGGNKPACVVT